MGSQQLAHVGVLGPGGGAGRRCAHLMALLGVVASSLLFLPGIGAGPAVASPQEQYSGPYFGEDNFPPGCIRDMAPTNPDNVCHHMRTGLNALDSPQVDVLVMVPVSPTAERDMRIMRQSVEMWEGGIDYLADQMGLHWLADGMDFHITVDYFDPAGSDGGEFTTYPIVDPEIVVIASNPVGGVGIGIDPMVFTDENLVPCHNVENPFDFDYWENLPGFNDHHETRSGTYVEDCGGAGGNICFAINGGIDPVPEQFDFFNLFDLVSHEFGHCLTLGHVGDGLDGEWGVVPTNDIMAYDSDPPHGNKCVSTLDVEAVAIRMSGYLDVNADGQVDGADRLLANDQIGQRGNPFQVQHPDDHLYASSTGSPLDCPQPDLGPVPRLRTDWTPTPVASTRPDLTVRSCDIGAVGMLPDESNVLDGVAFATPALGFGIGIGMDAINRSRLLRTTDGGISWTVVPALDTRGTWLEDVQFVDALNGWVVGDAIWRTTDGGESWKAIAPPVLGTRLRAVHFVDSTHGWAVGVRAGVAVVIASKDGGLTWREQPVAGQRLEDVVMFNRHVGYAVGYQNNVRTTDGGLTWLPGSLPSDYYVAIAPVGPQSAFTSGYGGNIYRSEDAGARWTWTARPASQVSEVAVSGTLLAVAGAAGQLVTSVDAGRTWMGHEIGNADVLSVAVRTPHSLVATTADGRVIELLCPPAPPVLTFSAATAEQAQYSDDVRVEARLVASDGTAIVGAPVQLSAGTSETVTVLTDAEGTVAAHLTVVDPAGQVDLRAVHHVEGQRPVSATRTLTVLREQPQLDLTQEGRGAETVLSAHLHDPDESGPHAPISGRSVEFFVGEELVGVGTTDDAGRVSVPRPPGNPHEEATAVFEGDDFYAPVRTVLEAAHPPRPA